MYCINPDSDEPIFLLFDQIGRDDEKPYEPYINGNDFARELLMMDSLGKKRIQIWINSEGGSVKEGYSICAAMLKTKTKIDTLNVGIAYSMAGIILSMGRKREGMDYSLAMCHLAYNPDGSKDDGLNYINESITTALCGRTKKEREEMGRILARTTFFTATEAEQAGIIDEVLPSNESNIPRKTTDAKALWGYGNKILNKLLSDNGITKEDLSQKQIQQQSKPTYMKTVAKFIGLNEQASEEAILNEVTSIKNRYDAAIAKNAELEKAKNAAEAERDNLKKEKEASDKKVEEAAKNAEKEAVKAKAKSKIESVAKERNITLDEKAVEKYVALAGDTEEGLTAVVEILETIPSTKRAPVIEVKNLGGAGSEKLGIPVIATVGTDRDGNPIAGDTKDYVNALNSFDFKKYTAKG